MWIALHKAVLKDELRETVYLAMFIAACTESQSPNVLPYQVTNETILLGNQLKCHLQLKL